jgi:nitroreductase
LSETEQRVPAGYPAHRPAETSVPVHPLIAARWSPVRFDEHAPVARDELLALLEAARWAPSAGNMQPWRFLVVPRGHPRREAVEAALSRGNAYAKRAPVLIVTVAKETREKEGVAEPNRWAEHDTGLATALLLVQAVALGLAAHPMAGWNADLLGEALRIPPDHRPLAVIAVGRYDPDLRDEALEEKEARPRARKPLGEIAFVGALGESPI